MKKENALVIGGTGFFGYHICKTLHKKFKVFSLSKSQPTAQRKLKNVKYLFGDIRKLSSINFLNNHKFKYVINSGGYVDHINEKLTKDTHFIGIKNLYKIGYRKTNRINSNINRDFITKAFQRRFRQELINGKIDKECLIISKNLTN